MGSGARKPQRAPRRTLILSHALLQDLGTWSICAQELHSFLGSGRSKTLQTGGSFEDLCAEALQDL